MNVRNVTKLNPSKQMSRFRASEYSRLNRPLPLPKRDKIRNKIIPSNKFSQNLKYKSHMMYKPNGNTLCHKSSDDLFSVVNSSQTLTFNSLKELFLSVIPESNAVTTVHVHRGSQEISNIDRDSLCSTFKIFDILVWNNSDSSPYSISNLHKLVRYLNQKKNHYEVFLS